MKYYHELTEDEYNKLKERGLTYGELAKLHPQPDWCEYPDAICGEMGCWHLTMLHAVKTQADCALCDFRRYPDTHRCKCALEEVK